MMSVMNFGIIGLSRFNPHTTMCNVIIVGIKANIKRYLELLLGNQYVLHAFIFPFPSGWKMVKGSRVANPQCITMKRRGGRMQLKKAQARSSFGTGMYLIIGHQVSLV